MLRWFSLSLSLSLSLLFPNKTNHLLNKKFNNFDKINLKPSTIEIKNCIISINKPNQVCLLTCNEKRNVFYERCHFYINAGNTSHCYMSISIRLEVLIFKLSIKRHVCIFDFFWARVTFLDHVFTNYKNWNFFISVHSKVTHFQHPFILHEE